MCNDTSRESGADLAKFDKYLRENVRETDFSRIIDTPGSDESSVVLAFLLVCNMGQLRAHLIDDREVGRVASLPGGGGLRIGRSGGAASCEQR
jgi:hypothetical protein